MSKLAPTRWRYGPGYINVTARGTYSAYVSLGHGRRRRAVLKSLAEAKAWIMAGGGASPDQALLEDALRAREILPPGMTILDAASYWLERHPNAGRRTPLSEAWDAYEAEVSRLIRRRTLSSYRQAVAALCAAVGDDAVLDAVTASRIEALLAGRTPHTRNNYIRALSAFFGWCASHGLAGENPVAGVRRARIPRPTPAVLSPADAGRLLAVAAECRPSTVAYFALGLFAGLRPEEAMRVRPRNVANGYVVLDAGMTKTADARTVRVRPCLAAWLADFPIPADGFVERHVKAVRHAFGGWTPDVCRHSFATYAYEVCHDAAAVAAEMGHAGTEIFFRHYRALAAPGSGAAFFAITPPSPGKRTPPAGADRTEGIQQR